MIAKNERGQILLPGLVLFLGIFLFFLITVILGVRTIHRMRVENAAQACALSMARARAESLNRKAAHNLMLHTFGILRVGKLGLMQASAAQAFHLWLVTERFWDVTSLASLLGAKAHVASVGSRVARLNGVSIYSRKNFIKLSLIGAGKKI